jgi:hypothetical protein
VKHLIPATEDDWQSQAWADSPSKWAKVDSTAKSNIDINMQK